MATLYEDNIRKLLDEKKQKLDELKDNSNTSKHEIDKLEDEIRVLTMLYENYNIGMAVFRRAKRARERNH